jgi:hypothetical protein
MNPEQDCKSIRQHTIRMICFDLSGGIGVLDSCANMLNKIAIKELLYDDSDVVKIIEVVQDHQQHSESLFSLFIDDMKSNLESCGTELSDIFDQINTIYQADFKTLYVHLKQLEDYYLAKGQLDVELTNVLIYHADNLSQFLQSLRDEVADF